MSGSRHATEIRRRVLVENPIIMRFMKRAMATEKLVAQLQREYAEMRKIIQYVKHIDRTTAKGLSASAVYRDFPKKTKTEAKSKSSKSTKRKRAVPVDHAAPVKLDNIIPFPVQKKSTKAA